MSKKSHGSTDAILKELRAFGLTYPGAETKSPWPGHADLAVKGKTFAYLSLEGEPFSVSLKLPPAAASQSDAPPDRAAVEIPFSPQAVLPPELPEKPGNEEFTGFQEILWASHISRVGASFSGSSKLASVTSIVSGQSSKVSVVPQLAQKVLVTPSEEEYLAGTPSTSSKSARETTPQATLWAPAARLQLLQWQMLVDLGLSSI